MSPGCESNSQLDFGLADFTDNDKQFWLQPRRCSDKSNSFWPFKISDLDCVSELAYRRENPQLEMDEF